MSIDTPALELTNILLEIHFINISGGDAVAVVVYDLDGNAAPFRMLIDAGGEGCCKARLDTYIATHWGKPKFDLVVASHYHSDHISGFYTSELEFNRVMDIGGYKLGGVTYPAPKGVGKGGQGAASGYFGRITRKPPVERETRSEFKLRADLPITLKLCCASGVVNGTDHLAGVARRYIDPNDLSLALLLEWKDGDQVFRYFTAGDLSGDLTLKRYYNLEEPLVAYLTAQGQLGDAGVTVLKASHHGSNYSTYKPPAGAGLLDRLKPDMVVVTANTFKDVPGERFLERVADYSGGKVAVALVNDVDYTRDFGHVGKLKKLQENGSWCNVEIDDAGARVADTSAVVVRRRSGGGEVDRELKNRKGQATRRTAGGGYEIVILSDPQNADAPFQQHRVTAVAPDIEVSIKGTLRLHVDLGFQTAADKIAGWWNLDETEEEPWGALYTDFWYPSLAPVRSGEPAVEWPAKLVVEMKRLFDGYYHLVDGDYNKKPDPDTENDPDANSLDWEERKTLYNLIWKNRWQPEVNKSWAQKWKAWNKPDEEPYRVAPEPDAGDATVSPDAKRRRTEHVSPPLFPQPMDTDP